MSFPALHRIDGGDWSTQSAVVCTWNLQRGGLKAQQAAQTLDVPTAVTALCCHPSQPALIAGEHGELLESAAHMASATSEYSDYSEYSEYSCKTMFLAI